MRRKKEKEMYRNKTAKRDMIGYSRIMFVMNKLCFPVWPSDLYSLCRNPVSASKSCKHHLLLVL